MGATSRDRVAPASRRGVNPPARGRGPDDAGRTDHASRPTPRPRESTGWPAEVSVPGTSPAPPDRLGSDEQPTSSTTAGGVAGLSRVIHLREATSPRPLSVRPARPHVIEAGGPGPTAARRGPAGGGRRARTAGCSAGPRPGRRAGRRSGPGDGRDSRRGPQPVLRRASAARDRTAAAITAGSSSMHRPGVQLIAIDIAGLLRHLLSSTPPPPITIDRRVCRAGSFEEQYEIGAAVATRALPVPGPGAAYVLIAHGIASAPNDPTAAICSMAAHRASSRIGLSARMRFSPFVPVTSHTRTGTPSPRST